MRKTVLIIAWVLEVNDIDSPYLMQLWNMTSCQRSGESIISCYFTGTIGKCYFTWLIWLASGQSTSIGWDESFASRLSALFRCSEMKLESTFHSGNTLCEVSCRSRLQNKIGLTCLRNQRVSLIRCDTPKNALTRNNDLSHLRSSGISNCKNDETLHNWHTRVAKPSLR